VCYTTAKLMHMDPPPCPCSPFHLQHRQRKEDRTAGCGKQASSRWCALLSCAPPQMPGLLCAVIQLYSSMGLRYSCNSKEPKQAKPRMSGRNLLCVLTPFIHRCTLVHAIQTMYSQSCAARTVHCASMGYPDEVACSMSFRHCCYQFLCVPALPSPGMEHAPAVAQACTKARQHDTAAQVGECARTLLGQRVHSCGRGGTQRRDS
jgi:hypothetical protein